MSLENSDILELKDRYLYLIKQYVQMSVELAPKLDRFGQCRKELQIIIEEFLRRGYDPQEPEGLNVLIESELAKLNLQESEEDGS